MIIQVDQNLIIHLRKQREKDVSLYCSKCDHTGKIYYINTDNEADYSYCECFKKRTNENNYPKLLKDSRLPTMSNGFELKDYKNTGVTKEDIDLDNKSIQRMIEISNDSQSFVDQGRNIYIQGQRGTGKTIIACALAKQLMKNGNHCAYVEFPIICDQLLKSDITEEDRDWFDYVRWCRLLILDNIDSFQVKSHFHATLFERIVRPRVQNNQSCCYIAVKPFKTINEDLSYGCQSLISERLEALTFVGQDFRSRKQ